MSQGLAWVKSHSLTVALVDNRSPLRRFGTKELRSKGAIRIISKGAVNPRR